MLSWSRVEKYRFALTIYTILGSLFKPDFKVKPNGGPKPQKNSHQPKKSNKR